jgi:YD repeat-containing protein
VQDCPHFVTPLNAQHVRVTDAKVQSLAYNPNDRILEIRFNSGQVWQVFGVPEGVYKELFDSTISSFLNFIARRYKAAPVRTSARIVIPQTEKCPKCESDMTQRHRTSSNMIDKYVRVLWACSKCDKTEWKTSRNADRSQGANAMALT